MAPPRSFRTIGALVACGATAVQAATQSYQLSEEYTADNFFDKFDFFVSTYTSDDSWDATHGFVQYRSQADAESLGLISTTSSGAVYIGPDTNGTYNATGTGRDSVRITSKASYNQGLMIAEFSHMPAQACGAWPAFWSYGSPWLTMGEIDYYEGWDLQGHNRMAMHTNGTLSGACTLSTSGMTGTILTESCVNDSDETGCGVEDDSGVWASSTGATFAMQWTDDAIKVWSWVPSSIPSDVTAGSPVPSGWGEPTMMVQQDNCDLASSFANQQLVFNIDFCGDTAGSPTFWDTSCSALSDSCASYVAENPAAFADTYFMVEGIKYYELGVAATTSAAVVSTTAVSVASTSASAVVTLSTSTLPASSSSSSAGILGGVGSVLESTLGVAATSASLSATSEAAAVLTSSYSHSTGYVYATSVSTDELGSETTVVVTVDTTICPVTAAEASSSAAAAASSSLSSAAVVDAQTTPIPIASATGGLAPPSAASSASSVSTATSESSPVEQTSAVSSVHTTGAAAVPSSSASSEATSSSSTHSVSTSLRTLTLSIPATAITSVSKSNSKSAAADATSIDSSSTEVISLSLYTSATGLITATSATATTEVISSTDLGGGDALETASASPTSISLDWLTAAATGIYSYNATGSGVASSTGGASAAKATDTCSGLDCIVVSSSAPGGKNWQGDASTLALVAFAGIALLL